MKIHLITWNFKDCKLYFGRYNGCTHLFYNDCLDSHVKYFTDAVAALKYCNDLNAWYEMCDKHIYTFIDDKIALRSAVGSDDWRMNRPHDLIVETKEIIHLRRRGLVNKIKFKSEDINYFCDTCGVELIRKYIQVKSVKICNQCIKETFHSLQ